MWSLNGVDVAFQTVLGVVALTAVNRLVYHESLAASVGFAAAVMLFFWLGRMSVRLLRRMARAERLSDE
jgi:hypothetical protein